MSFSAEQRIIQRLAKGDESDYKRRARLADEAQMLEEIRLQPGAVAAYAVYDLYDAIDRANRPKLPARIRVANQLVRFASGGRKTRKVHHAWSTPTVEGLPRRVYELKGKINGERVELPIEETSHDGHVFTRSWVLEPSGGSFRSLGCNISLQTKESESDLSETQRQYYIQSTWLNGDVVQPDSTAVFEGTIQTYTDGVKDNALITLAKDPELHIVGIIQQAKQHLGV